jgi:hypothetical protein
MANSVGGLARAFHVRAKRNRERVYDFCLQDFEASTARFGDVHCGDLVARPTAIEERLAAGGRAHKRSRARKARYEAIRRPKICVVVLSDGYRE